MPLATPTPRRPAAAALAAGAAACLVEIALAYAQGTHRPVYDLASVAASLALAGLLGAGVRAAGGGAKAALTAWAAVAGGLSGGALLGAVAAAATFGLLRRPAGADVPPTRAGLVVGGVLAVAVIAGLRVAERLPAGLPPGVAPAVLYAVLLAVAVPVARWIAPTLRARLVLAPAVVLVLVAAGAAELAARRAPTPPVRRAGGPHVFLLVLDTVRADHLSLYGYARDTMPRLARRVAEHPGALVHPWAFSNGSWTAPSHATLLTGLLPSQHDVHLGTPAAESMDWSLPTHFALRAERTLAERFGAAGYATIAVYANVWLDRIEGLARGFEVYERVRRHAGLPLVGEALRQRITPSWHLDDASFVPPATSINAALLQAIDARPDRPLFVLANYLDAHAPYGPPPGSRGRFAPWSPFERPLRLRADLPPAQIQRLMARYDESILGLDADLDALLDALDARGILDDAWVFVTADHGEAFGEHGVTDHGTSVYDEEVRIPLVVLPPRGVRVEAEPGPVSLASIAATAAAIAGAPLADDADLRGGGPGRAVIEFYADPSKAKSQGALGAEPAQAVVIGTEKLVRYRDRQELFDLAADPRETR
ncbi:MAG TPA: sulfatase, partial [Myxococcota bacterium]|nr:sulfatase [Myxococcota bacterium]